MGRAEKCPGRMGLGGPEIRRIEPHTGREWLRNQLVHMHMQAPRICILIVGRSDKRAITTPFEIARQQLRRLLHHETRCQRVLRAAENGQ